MQQQLSIAATFKKRRVNVGGSGFDTELRLAKILMPPKIETKYETLKTDEKTWEDLDEEDSYVKIGDPVVQIKTEEIEEK